MLSLTTLHVSDVGPLNHKIPPPPPGVNRKAGSVDLSHAKPNGKLVETPLTLQQFHERRKKLEGLNSIHFKSGSSSSLNVPMTSMSSSHVEIPRSSTLNADFPARRLIPVDETEPSIPAKKGSIRHTRGHRRGKSWGGSKGLDAELSEYTCVCVGGGGAICTCKEYLLSLLVE